MAQRSKPSQGDEDVVFPNEILEAIEYAKKSNPKDLRGADAIKIDTDKARKAGKTSWIDTYINILRDGTRQWKLIKVIVIRLPTKANIPSPEDRKKRKDEGGDRIQLQFRDKDSYKMKRPDGTEEMQRYGEAMLALHYAWRIKAMQLLKEKKFKGVASTLRRGVLQTHRGPASENKSDKKSTYASTKEEIPPENILIEEDDADPCHDSDKIAFGPGDRIIRVQIEFMKEGGKDEEKTVAEEALPKIPILDATKPLKNKQLYEEARTRDGELINYSNIHDWLRCDSQVTGVIDMSSTCLSNMGISISNKFTHLIVRASKGASRPNYSNVTSSFLLADPEEDEGEDDKEEDGEAASAAKPPAPKASAKASSKGTKVPPADPTPDPEDSDEDDDGAAGYSAKPLVASPAKPAAKTPAKTPEASPAKPEKKKAKPPTPEASDDEAADEDEVPATPPRRVTRK